MFNKIKNLILDHKLILFIALVAGLLIFLPRIISIYNIGFDNFEGVYPILNGDEPHYMLRAEAVKTGHYSLGNAYFFEHQNDPYVQPPLAEIFFSFFSNLFNISTPFLFLVNSFILPAVAVILIYLNLLAFGLSKNRSALFSLYFFILFIVSFAMPTNPQFSFIFLIAGIHIIWKLFDRKMEKKEIIYYNILLGIIFSILFYIYPFFWSAIIVVYVLSIFWLAVMEKNKNILLINFVPFFSFVALASIPYLYNLSKLFRSPFYQETLERIGLISGNHWPATYVNVGLIVIAISALILGKNKISNKKLFNFLILLMLSAWILNWQNVLTGGYMAFSSHYFEVTIYFIFFIISVLVSNFQKLRFNYRDGLTIVALAIIIAVPCYKNFPRINSLLNGTSKDILLQQQKMKTVFNWINDNTETDSVMLILGGDDDTMFPLYTHAKLYSGGYGGAFLLSDDELEDRWIRSNIFNDKVNADYIKANNASIWLFKFVEKYQNNEIRRKIFEKLTGTKKPESIYVPSEYIERMVEKNKVARSEGVERALKKFKLDYLVVNAKNNEFIELNENLKKYTFLKPAFKSENYNIYEVR